MKDILRPKKQVAKKAAVIRRAFLAKRSVASKIPAMTKAQQELYVGITESGCFTLESTKDSFAGITRLRNAVQA